MSPSARLVSLLRFGLVGSLGFLVDAAIVFLCANCFNIDPLLSRIPAWIAAVSTTYNFNSRFTFKVKGSPFAKNRKSLTRYLFYVVSQLSGGCINIVVFSSLVYFGGMDWFWSIVIGTLSGIVVNFYGASLAIKSKF